MTSARCAIPSCESEVATISVCALHHARLVDALGHGLVRLYVELNLSLLPGQGGSDDPIVSTSPNKRLPLDAGARDAQEQILNVVLEAEDGLRHRQGWIARPRRGREGPTLQAACGVLLDHLEHVLVDQAAVIALDRLTGRARQCMGQGGRTPNRIPVACPSCGSHSIVRTNGTDLIACVSCAATMTADELELLLDPIIEREEAA